VRLQSQQSAERSGLRDPINAAVLAAAGVPTGSTHQPAGMLKVDPTNVSEENVIFGVELHSAWVNSPPSASGFVCDAAGPSDAQNVHCFPDIGCDSADNTTIATWGMTGKRPWVRPEGMFIGKDDSRGRVMLPITARTQGMGRASPAAPLAAKGRNRLRTLR
jgi:hypothetical protein